MVKSELMVAFETLALFLFRNLASLTTSQRRNRHKDKEPVLEVAKPNREATPLFLSDETGFRRGLVKTGSTCFDKRQRLKRKPEFEGT